MLECQVQRLMALVSFRCEFFKLHLSSAGSNTAEHLPSLPPGKTPKDVIADYISCLWEHCKAKITEHTGSVAEVGKLSLVQDWGWVRGKADCLFIRRASDDRVDCPLSLERGWVCFHALRSLTGWVGEEHEPP